MADMRIICGTPMCHRRLVANRCTRGWMCSMGLCKDCKIHLCKWGEETEWLCSETFSLAIAGITCWNHTFMKCFYRNRMCLCILLHAWLVFKTWYWNKKQVKYLLEVDLPGFSASLLLSKQNSGIFGYFLLFTTANDVICKTKTKG